MSFTDLNLISHFHGINDISLICWFQGKWRMFGWVLPAPAGVGLEDGMEKDLDPSVMIVNFFWVSPDFLIKINSKFIMVMFS